VGAFDSGEDCGYVRGVVRTTLGVGSSAGTGNAASWSFQQTPPTVAILKARSNDMRRRELIRETPQSA